MAACENHGNPNCTAQGCVAVETGLVRAVRALHEIEHAYGSPHDEDEVTRTGSHRPGGWGGGWMSEPFFKPDDFRNCVHLVEGDAPSLLADRANKLLRERGAEVYRAKVNELRIELGQRHTEIRRLRALLKEATGIEDGAGEGVHTFTSTERDQALLSELDAHQREPLEREGGG